MTHGRGEEMAWVGEVEMSQFRNRRQTKIKQKSPKKNQKNI